MKSEKVETKKNSSYCDGGNSDFFKKKMMDTKARNNYNANIYESSICLILQFQFLKIKGLF